MLSVLSSQSDGAEESTTSPNLRLENVPPATAATGASPEATHLTETPHSGEAASKAGDVVNSSEDVLEPPVSGNVRKFVFQCGEGDCGFSCGHRDRFVTHLRCLHHLRADERVLDFNDWAAFISWKEDLERETHASFVRVRVLLSTAQVAHRNDGTGRMCR